MLMREDALSVEELADIKEVSREEGFIQIYLQERDSRSHQTALARARSRWYRPEV